jgi:hypothetical protein
MTTTTTRRVLLLSSDGDAHPLIEQMLTSAGYELRRCVEQGDAPFPCAAMIPGGRGCPLDDGLVDVALDVRDHPWPQPTAREVGVRCALRERVPLAVIGRSAFSPFGELADVTVEGDSEPVAACERAIESSLERHRGAAVDAVADVLRTHEVGDAPITVSVSRRAGQLRVRVVAAVPQALRTTVVVRVGAALRALDQRARAIEIELVAD